MVIRVMNSRVCFNVLELSVWEDSTRRSLELGIFPRPRLSVRLDSVTIGIGRLKGAGFCYEVLLCLGEFQLINLNRNVFRVRKNLGSKIVLFNKVVRS